jgi:hypothetical protein
VANSLEFCSVYRILHYFRASFSGLSSFDRPSYLFDTFSIIWKTLLLLYFIFL